MTARGERCGAPFEARLSSARFCSGRCRAAASRARRDGRPVALVPAVVRAGPGPVESAVLAHLGERVSLPVGAGAVVLARVIDVSPVGASGFASLLRELRLTLASLDEDAPRVPTIVDELKARRARRIRAARRMGDL